MAPKTRATNKPERSVPIKTKKIIQSKQDKLQKRLLAELHTEGTGLKGDFPERRPGVYYRGAWYEEAEVRDRQPEPTSRKRRRSYNEEPQPGRVSKRSRRAPTDLNEDETARPSPSSTEVASTETETSRDEEFLRVTERELRASKAAKNSIRRHDIRKLLPFFSNASVARTEDTLARAQTRRPSKSVDFDMYLLTKTEAHRLLRSNEAIDIPIFVPDGTQPLFDPALDDRRPIEQVLDFFLDPTEIEETIDVSKSVRTSKDLREVPLSALRTRFLDPPGTTTTTTITTGPVTYPWNFPDIPNPLPETGVPSFLRSPHTSILKSLVRNLLISLQPRAVCCRPDADACAQGEACPHVAHHSAAAAAASPTSPSRETSRLLSVPEVVHVQTGWHHWQSTMMLAEPGAVTLAHWDKWGFGTWIACYEGEMGFAWLSRPTEEERTRWLVERDGYALGRGDDEVEEGGKAKWVFRVLRPGDVLYMPSGTVHLVFRRPRGGQTLGFAGHVVRAPDVGAWLRTLTWEVEDEIRSPDVSVPYGDVVPSLLAGLKAIIGRDDMSEQEIERYGGQEKLQEARSQLGVLEDMVENL